MAKYAISQEGADAMIQLSANITSASDGIKQSTTALKNQIMQYMDDLGVYGLDIWAMTMQIDGIMEDKQESLTKLSDMAKSKADVIMSLINATNGGGSGMTNGETSTSLTKQEGYELGEMQNGMKVIKGENYDQYYQNYYDYDSFTFESLRDSVVVDTVRPSQIEGVHLGDSEANDSGTFWNMHASSKDFFMETASHIPEVRTALNDGRSLEDLKSDPVLGRCASIYFDPENIPRVERWDGYYTFDGDGRHRILAARELGYDIPVRVVGVRRHE